MALKPNSLTFNPLPWCFWELGAIFISKNTTKRQLMDKQVITGIYAIISPTGKTYIGQSKNISKRWYFYKALNYTKRQPKLHASFKGHGYENHEFKILMECPENELHKWEEHFKEKFIKEHGWAKALFFNIQDTAITGRERKKVYVFDCEGVLLSEHASTYDAAQSLELDPSTIAKCARQAKGYKTYKGFQFRYEDNKDNIGPTKRGLNNVGCPVNQLLEGVVINTYKSINNAATKTKLYSANIWRATKTGEEYGGYEWILTT